MIRRKTTTTTTLPTRCISLSPDFPENYNNSISDTALKSHISKCSECGKLFTNGLPASVAS